MEKSPPWLTGDGVWSQFAQSRNTAATHYRPFVREGVGHPSIWKDVQGQALLGEPDFVERLRGYLRRSEKVPEIPRRQRYVGRPPLPQVFAGKLSRARRDALIVQAVERHGYSQKEGADAVGLHYSTVSRESGSQPTKGKKQDLTPFLFFIPVLCHSCSSAKKHGRNVGRVAVARAMLKTIYAMLTKQEAFRPMAKGSTGQRPGVMVG
jgi:hypothetical protein